MLRDSAFGRGLIASCCLLAGCGAETRSGADDRTIVKQVELNDVVVVSLAALQPSVAQGKDIEVLFTISNHTGQSFTLLPWGTPLETILSADNFEVIYNDKVLPYVGRVVKRAPPQESDYLLIAAGDEVTAVVNLSNAYELESAGQYQVQLKAEDGSYRAHGYLLPVISPSLLIKRL